MDPRLSSKAHYKIKGLPEAPLSPSAIKGGGVGVGVGVGGLGGGG